MPSMVSPFILIFCLVARIYAGMTPPMNLKATNAGIGAILITWQPPQGASCTPSFYVLSRGVTKSGMHVVGIVDGGVEYLDVGIMAEPTFHALTAVGSCGNATASTSTPTTPSLPHSGTVGTLIDASTSQYPRRGEGSILVLPNTNGELLFALARQHQGNDMGVSDIVTRRSSDGGSTWGAEVVVGAANNESRALASLGITKDKSTLLLSYAVGSHESARRIIRQSTDGGKTWGPEMNLTHGLATYETGSMDRMRTLSNGRILYPVHFRVPNSNPVELVTVVYGSDDNGNTWQALNPTSPLQAPSGGFPDANQNGFYEAALDEDPAQHGHLLIVGRTSTGWLYASWSTDYGDTWATPVRTNIPNPLCDTNLRKNPSPRGGFLFANDPIVNVTSGWALGDRYILAIRNLASPFARLPTPKQAPDGAPTLFLHTSNYTTLEDDQKFWYSYPSLTFVCDGDACTPGSSSSPHSQDVQLLTTYYKGLNGAGRSVYFQSLPWN